MKNYIHFKNAILNGTETDILVVGNRFEKIVPAGSVPEFGKNLDGNGANAEIVDCRGLAVLPPFCNAHTHAAMTLLRGIADDIALFPWLEKHIWPVEAKLTARDIYDGSRLAALEMIRSGTVFFNDMYFEIDETVRAARELGLRAVIGMTVTNFTGKGKIDAMFARLKSLPKGGAADASGRIRFAVAPHAIYTVSEKLLLRCAETARDAGVLLHIHLSETEKEVADCVAAHGTTPVRWLDSLGILGENVVAAHVVHVDDEEIEILRERGVAVAHNPCSNMKLASGIFPAEKMSRAGVKITLGTDGAASNNNLDMREEMKFAALLAKVSGNPEAAPANEVFDWVTRAGFSVFGIDAGEIAEGKLADALFIDLNDERFAPGRNLVSDWVYAADTRCIRHVVCDGKFLMRDGIVPEEKEILEAARRAPIFSAR